MGGSNGWLAGSKDYKKENSKTRPKATPIKRRFEPLSKIRRGKFKADFVNASADMIHHVREEHVNNTIWELSTKHLIREVKE